MFQTNITNNIKSKTVNLVTKACKSEIPSVINPPLFKMHLQFINKPLILYFPYRHYRLTATITLHSLRMLRVEIIHFWLPTGFDCLKLETNEDYVGAASHLHTTPHYMPRSWISWINNSFGTVNTIHMHPR